MGGPATVDDVVALLARFASDEREVAGDVPAVLIAHGAQCAELLMASHPDDAELQVAGLLHDIGLLLEVGDEDGHPRHGAEFARPLFGDRVARLIALHVEAERYLAATAPDSLDLDTTISAAQQQAFGRMAPMTAAEAERFAADPLFDSLMDLRRADDMARDVHRRERNVERWRPLLERVA